MLCSHSLKRNVLSTTYVPGTVPSGNVIKVKADRDLISEELAEELNKQLQVG